MRNPAIVAALCVLAACDSPATSPIDQARTLGDASVNLALAVRGRGEIAHTADLAGATSCSVPAGAERLDCVLTYALNTVITLQPKPAAGYVFDHWSGRCAGKGTCTTTMNERLTMEAIFKTVVVPPTSYTMKLLVRGRGEVRHTVDMAGAGSCTAQASTSDRADCTLTYGANADITLTPIPAAGFHFAGWGGACTSAGSGVCTLKVNESRTLEIVFRS